MINTTCNLQEKEGTWKRKNTEAKWLARCAGERKKRKEGKNEMIEYSTDGWVTCLNNQILLFMWSKLLHAAMGHMQKLNDKLMGFCVCASKNSKGSYADVHAVCLVIFATSLKLILGLFFFPFLFFYFIFACRSLSLSKLHRNNERERGKGLVSEMVLVVLKQSLLGYSLLLYLLHREQ